MTSWVNQWLLLAAYASGRAFPVPLIRAVCIYGNIMEWMQKDTVDSQPRLGYILRFVNRLLLLQLVLHRMTRLAKPRLEAS